MGRAYSRSFFAFRYYLSRADDSLLYQDRTEEERQQIFIDRVMHHQEFKLRKNSNPIAITGVSGSNGIYVGKLARRKPSRINQMKGQDIEEVTTDNWPYSQFVADTRPGVQLILIQQNSDLSFKPIPLSSTLSVMFSPKFLDVGYEISFKAIVDNREFWQIIDNAEQVFRLKLDLSAPNMFGANKKAREELNFLKSKTNFSSLELDLSNEAGDLHVSRDQMQSYIDYADGGGGEWTIQTRSEGSDRKKTIRGMARAMMVSAKYEGDAEPEQLRGLLNEFRQKIDSGDY